MKLSKVIWFNLAMVSTIMYNIQREITLTEINFFLLFNRYSYIAALALNHDSSYGLFSYRTISTLDNIKTFQSKTRRIKKSSIIKEWNITTNNIYNVSLWSLAAVSEYSYEIDLIRQFFTVFSLKTDIFLCYNRLFFQKPMTSKIKWDQKKTIKKY